MGQHSGSNEGQPGPVPLPESTAHGAVRPESATLGHPSHHQTTNSSSGTVSAVEVAAEQSVASSYYFNDQDTM